MSVCTTPSKSCTTMTQLLTPDIIFIVEYFYLTLQIYANNIFDTDNTTQPITNENFGTAIVKERSNPQTGQLVAPEYMEKLHQRILQMLSKAGDLIESGNIYYNELSDIQFFGGGDLSPTIIISATRNGLPLVIKIVPIEFPHQAAYASRIPNIDVNRDIASPSLAIYFKEAFMYCFSKIYLQKYTPTFNCIAECKIISNFPIPYDQFKALYIAYAEKRAAQGKPQFNKRWLAEYFERPQEFTNVNFGIYEMSKIEGTFSDMYKKGELFNLGLIFEYFYTKLVSSVIGRIIFTDDHFGNVAYITVDYWRHYTVITGGIKFDWYIPPGRMVQFIDLERYVFNYSEYDLYTNTKLKAGDLPNNIVSNQYMYNSALIDKTVLNFLNIFNRHAEASVFAPDEVDYAKRIMSNAALGYNASFGLIFNDLPPRYKSRPQTGIIRDYQIVFDSTGADKPVITKDMTLTK